MYCTLPLLGNSRNRVARSRSLCGTALVFVIFAIAWPTLASAETLTLVCTETALNWLAVTPCAPNCPTVAVEIDMTQGTATIPATMGRDPGSYRASIAESTITWASEHYDFELGRYTGVLHQTADPKHGEEMFAGGVDWKCSTAQRQF